MSKLDLKRLILLTPSEVKTGIFIIIFLTLFYQILQIMISYYPYAYYTFFKLVSIIAYLYYILFFIGVFLILYGIKNLIKKSEYDNLLLKPKDVIIYLFKNSKYKKILSISAIIYGSIYSVLTGIIVYSPYDLSSYYQIPSFTIVPLYGPPLQIPILVLYISGNLGLIIIPLNFLLLITLSLLVGLNVALLVLSASMRFVQINQGFLASIGVFLGFFTGCVACASLIFSALGTVGLAIALSIYPYQNFLNVGTVLLLSLTAFLASRSISKNCCKVNIRKTNQINN